MHHDIIIFTVKEGEHVMAKNLKQAESPVQTIEHMISTEACLVLTVTGWKLKHLKLTKRSLLTRNGS